MLAAAIMRGRPSISSFFFNFMFYNEELFWSLAPPPVLVGGVQISDGETRRLKFIKLILIL